MPGLEKQSSVLTQEQIEGLAERGIERLLDPSKRRRETWLVDKDRRKKAIDILRAQSKITLTDFAKEMGSDVDNMKNSINTWTGRIFGKGGREVLLGILERLEEKEKGSSI